MSAQPWPPASQRRHWYVNAIGSVPVHVPGSAVSVSPSRAVPATDGAAVGFGATGSTTPLMLDVAVAEPASFVAVTTTRNCDPTSAETGVYARAPAPGMSVHSPVSATQRCHW